MTNVFFCFLSLCPFHANSHSCLFPFTDKVMGFLVASEHFISCILILYFIYYVHYLLPFSTVSILAQAVGLVGLPYRNIFI